MGSAKTQYQDGEKRTGSSSKNPKKLSSLYIVALVFLGFLY